MFDLDGLDRVSSRTSKIQTTQLYTKSFDKETWKKLDSPIPELGYEMTIQKYLKSKYHIVIEEDQKIESQRIELDRLLQENKVLCKNGNKMKTKFLLYAEDHKHLESFINEIEFKISKR
ncbi:MAG: hypothetical protein ISR81_04545 [Nitrosopumilus sp.]|nr:hypothetical protein [Nitrosopumilus sp.]